MADKATAVKVEALKAHTYNGKAYEVGDIYDFYPSTDPGGISSDDQVQSLANTGFALRVDRVKVAKEAAAVAEKSAKAQAKAADVLTTKNTGGLAKPRRGAKAAKRAKK